MERGHDSDPIRFCGSSEPKPPHASHGELKKADAPGLQSEWR